MNSPDDLSFLLQGWQPEVTDTRDFNRGVWMRLEVAESRKGIDLTAFLAWVKYFTRPRIAVTAAVLALFGGVFLGTIQSRAADEDQYLRSLNPYSAQSHQR